MTGLADCTKKLSTQVYRSRMHRKISQNLDQSLPAFTAATRPDHLRTRIQWKRARRKVRKGVQPVARLTWKTTEWQDGDCHATDGTVEEIKERVTVTCECGLFGVEQTAPYRGTCRTWAVEIFRRYFVEFTSPEYHIYWADPADPRWLKYGWPFPGEKKAGWKYGNGPLTDELLKVHLRGKGRYGVRGGKWTRFLALDLDLHDGDPAVFLDMLRVLLAEFHGKDGWHFQVAEKGARGIHLIRCFSKPRLVAEVRAELERKLQDLDRRHPDLAARALAAGMNPFTKVEIFPHERKGFRLPLCSGRTMLLDRPLPLVFNQRMKREVQDVEGYVSWLSRDEKTYMPAEEVITYVKDRLAPPKPKVQPKTERQAVGDSKNGAAADGLADLGPMKGQFAQKLVAFWTGADTPPDSLNPWIGMTARVLPFYLDDQEDAVALIERYIDELPDVSFSDRLSGGRRAEVSRVIRATVKTVYRSNGYQDDPATSTEKLQATVAAWKKRGFDPTDKTTWDRAAVNNLPDVSVNNFFWKAEDVIKLGLLQNALHASLETVSSAMKYLLNLVKKHDGEIAINLVKKVLEKFGIACGHHGKANKVMKLLCQWKWVYIRAFERWYPQEEDGEKKQGRARSYGVGAEMADKFEAKCGGNNTTHTTYLYIVSHHNESPEPVLATFEPQGDEISLGWP
ncbi:MAG: hypothetical protein K2R98_05260 [Gemmataceae bacterium]|nr:hypothetical protein [Gemmataceae bacterium]